MDKDERTDIYLCVSLLIALIIIVVGIVDGCHECEETNRAAIKSGLVQKQDNGWKVWVKPEERK